LDLDLDEHRRVDESGDAEQAAGRTHVPQHAAVRLGDGDAVCGEVDDVHPGAHHVGAVEAGPGHRVEGVVQRGPGLSCRVAGAGDHAIDDAGAPGDPRVDADNHRAGVAEAFLVRSTRGD